MYFLKPNYKINLRRLTKNKFSSKTVRLDINEKKTPIKKEKSYNKKFYATFVKVTIINL